MASVTCIYPAKCINTRPWRIRVLYRRGGVSEYKLERAYYLGFVSYVLMRRLNGIWRVVAAEQYLYDRIVAVLFWAFQRQK